MWHAFVGICCACALPLWRTSGFCVSLSRIPFCGAAAALAHARICSRDRKNQQASKNKLIAKAKGIESEM